MSQISDILGYQSPFLENEGFTNRSTSDLKFIFNQNFNLSNEEIIELLKDEDLTIKRFVRFIDKNNNNTFEEGIDTLKYRTVIFTSTNPIILKNAMVSLTPEPEQIILFIEDNTDDVFSTQKHYIKIGSEVNKELKKNIDSVNITNLFTTYNIGDGDDDTQIHELIKKQFTEISNWDIVKSTLYKIATIPFYIKNSVNNFAISILDSVINGLDSWKIDSKHWNPKILGSDKFKPLFFPFVNESNNDLIKDGIKSTIGKFKTDIKNSINNSFNVGYRIHFIPGGSGLMLYTSSRLLLDKYKTQALAYVDQQFDQLTPFLDGLLDFLKGGINFVNAILCGLVNSIIEAIAGIFQIVKLLFKIANIKGSLLFNSSDLLEKLDNAFQAFKKINFEKVLNSIKAGLSKIWIIIKNSFDDVNSDFSLEEIGYFIGYIIGFILEIIVGILFTGGVASVKAVFQKIFIKSKSLVDNIIDLIRRQFPRIKGKITKDFITYLTDFLKKGTDNFIKLIIEIKDAIMKWLLKNDRTNYLAKWDKLPVSEIGFLGAKQLSKKELRIWIKKIRKNKGQLKILHPLHPLFNGRQALFHAKSRQIFVKKGATEYEIFHEFHHLNELNELGLKEYLKGANGSLADKLTRTYKREKHVFDKVIEQNNKWSTKQLNHAKSYIDKVASHLQKEGIDLPKI